MHKGGALEAGGSTAEGGILRQDQKERHAQSQGAEGSLDEPVGGEIPEVVRGTLSLLAINVNGLREPGRLFAFESFVALEKPDVLIVTETHLTKPEAWRLNLDEYTVTTKSSTPRDGTRMRRGVVILVRSGGASRELARDLSPKLTLPLYSCTILVYLDDVEHGALKIKGVFLPPEGGHTAVQVRELTGSGSQKEFRGRRVGYVLARDFNRPSWETGYREWVGAHRVWELSDPAL